MTVSYCAILSVLPLINLCKIKERILRECRTYKLNSAKYKRGKSANRCRSYIACLVKANILIFLNVILRVSGL